MIIISLLGSGGPTCPVAAQSITTGNVPPIVPEQRCPTDGSGAFADGPKVIFGVIFS